jgi:FkbM family methyltransferase
MTDALAKLAAVVRKAEPSLKFTMLEVGAVPLGGEREPFHWLLELFPGSRVIAFEVDAGVCASLNERAPVGMRYYPTALGRRDETRSFYLTRHPMCASLYRPNEALISLYQNFEVAYLEAESTIRTVSLDAFIRDERIGAVDFIKIDIQGAELDVFEGGVETLVSTLAIVSEVEFVLHYLDQPLFGDVCRFLDQHGIMFHKFLGLAGRALRPIVLHNDPNFASQHIWSDAMFVRHVQRFADLDATQLLKLAVLAFLYGSPDLAFYGLKRYDTRHGTGLADELLRL